MERRVITGDDTVFLAAGEPLAAVGGFLDGMADLWPGVLVAVTADDGEGLFEEWPAIAKRLPAGTREVLVARDQSMVARWDEAGYSLDEHGEGPLCLLLAPSGRSFLQASLLEDPFGRDGLAFQPYEAVLITARSYIVTAVTPPTDSDFTKKVLALLKASFSA
jgi:hypothetical protein